MFHDVYTKSNWTNNLYFKDPLNLRRCMRFYSHQNDSGSFFVAVFKKLKNDEIDLSKYKAEENPLDLVSEINLKNNLIVKEIPLNKYKEISIKDDFDDLCKKFGKTFTDDENKNDNK